MGSPNDYFINITLCIVYIIHDVLQTCQLNISNSKTHLILFFSYALLSWMVVLPYGILTRYICFCYPKLLGIKLYCLLYSLVPPFVTTFCSIKALDYQSQYSSCVSNKRSEFRFLFPDTLPLYIHCRPHCNTHKNMFNIVSIHTVMSPVVEYATSMFQ